MKRNMYNGKQVAKIVSVTSATVEVVYTDYSKEVMSLATSKQIIKEVKS